MNNKTKEQLFDIATDIEGVSGRVADIRSLVSILLAEQGKDLPNMVWLETLSNVIIDMLDYQRYDLKSEAEKIYDIYYGRVSANNE